MEGKRKFHSSMEPFMEAYIKYYTANGRKEYPLCAILLTLDLYLISINYKKTILIIPHFRDGRSRLVI